MPICSKITRIITTIIPININDWNIIIIFNIFSSPSISILELEVLRSNDTNLEIMRFPIPPNPMH